MKLPISKAHIRTEIEQQIADFLNQGGAVEEVERGVSGRTPSDGALNPNKTSFQQPKEGRTYVPEVTAAIDARRGQKSIKPKPDKSQAALI